MLELTNLNQNHFNYQFFKFRVKYYFNETKELLARYKLLAAFVICLLAPGVKHIQEIGIPFYSLIDPHTTIKTKLIYLFSLLFFLLAMTKAQSFFIRGGVFREYLHTLYVPFSVHKTIDFIILLLSLNMVWLAVFFGGSNLHDFSYYCLYGVMIFALSTLLLNFLYKKIANVGLLFLALMIVILISNQENCLLNYGVSAGVFLLSGIILWIVTPLENKQSYSFKTPNVEMLNFGSLKDFFIIQLAVLRQNKTSFLIRSTVCLALSILLLQVLSSTETANNHGIALFLVSMQIYILSTLFTLFEKEKLEHELFHKIFPYQRLIQPIKEIILTWTGLVFILVPVSMFCFLSFKSYIPLLFVTLAMSSVILAINRIFYAQSLRFCLFSSLLSTVGGCVIQYKILGACFGL